MAETRLGDLLARVAAGETLTPAEANQIRLLANALQNLIGLSSKVDPLTGDITGELRAGPTLLARDGLTAGNGLVSINDEGVWVATGDNKDKAVKWLGTVDGADVLTNQMWTTYLEDGVSAGYDLAGMFLTCGIDYWGGHFYAGGSKIGLSSRVTDGAASYDSMDILVERYTGAVTAKSWRGVSIVRSNSGVETGSLFRVDATCPTEALLIGVGGTETVVNDHSEDLDWRMESDANANMFKLDAGLNCIGVGGAPTADCVLDVVSTTKAFRPPCMSTTQRDAIGTPVAGMVIYNTTTTALNFYNGAAWGAV